MINIYEIIRMKKTALKSAKLFLREKVLYVNYLLTYIVMKKILMTSFKKGKR